MGVDCCVQQVLHFTLVCARAVCHPISSSVPRSVYKHRLWRSSHERHSMPPCRHQGWSRVSPRAHFIPTGMLNIGLNRVGSLATGLHTYITTYVYIRIVNFSDQGGGVCLFGAHPISEICSSMSSPFAFVLPFCVYLSNLNLCLTSSGVLCPATI